MFLTNCCWTAGIVTIKIPMYTYIGACSASLFTILCIGCLRVGRTLPCPIWWTFKTERWLIKASKSHSPPPPTPPWLGLHIFVYDGSKSFGNMLLACCGSPGCEPEHMCAWGSGGGGGTGALTRIIMTVSTGTRELLFFLANWCQYALPVACQGALPAEQLPSFQPEHNGRN